MTQATTRRFSEIITEMREEASILRGEKEPDPVLTEVADTNRTHLAIPQMLTVWASDLDHIASGGEMEWNGGWSKVHANERVQKCMNIV